MGADSDSIRAIKERIDLADLVRRYVDLKPAAGRFMGLCPFHQEKTPSFSVNPQQGFFYCFGCQVTGDHFDFYARMNGVEFKEALEALAKEAGVELTRHTPDPQADKRRRGMRGCEAMHELAAKHYVANLSAPAARDCREYIAGRKLSDTVIDTFRIGYALDDWQGLGDALADKGYTPRQTAWCGLQVEKNGRTFDRFRNRLMFPITDVTGKVIAFGGRVIPPDDGPKYMNSSDTPIYKKGEHLFGLAQARMHITRSKRAILTEGYMDVVTLHQFGFEDSVGVLGTALTEQQVKKLAGFCKRVTLVFDGDSAGQEAALKSARLLLLRGVAVEVVTLPSEDDVDSLLHAHGAPGFEELLSAHEEGLAFAARVLGATRSPAEVMAWTTDFLQALADDALRSYFLPRLVDGLGIDETALKKSLGMQVGGRRGYAPRRGAPAQGASRQGPSSPKRMGSGLGQQRERQLLSFAARHPHLHAELAKRNLAGCLESDWALELWDALGCARQDEPEAGQGGDVYAILSARVEDDATSEAARAARDFYVREVATATPHADEDEAVTRRMTKEFGDICVWLEKTTGEARRQAILEDLKRAEAAGDRAAAEALTLQLQAICGRKR